MKKNLAYITMILVGIMLTSTFIISSDTMAAQQRRHRKKKTTAQKAQNQDRRKLTTIQTATTEGMKVLYLNLPWGEKTFSYLEDGGNDYYSTRTWPFAHVKLTAKASYEGTALEPGDYIVFITPRNADKNDQMLISLASFKPEGETFLVPGDVFTETPENIQVLAKKPVTFDKGAPLNTSLQIELKTSGKDISLDMHYGDRTHSEKFVLSGN